MGCWSARRPFSFRLYVSFSALLTGTDVDDDLHSTMTSLPTTTGSVSTLRTGLLGVPVEVGLTS